MRYAEIIYTDTTSREAVNRYMEQQIRQREWEGRRKSRQRNQMVQKFCGVLTIVLTVPAVMLEYDATIAIITVPLGLALIFAKEMIMTKFFRYETEKR